MHNALWRTPDALGALETSGEVMPNTQWEYFVQGLGRDQSVDEMHDTLAKLGRDGWELVSVLDQSADIGLQHKTDARMMILKRASWGASVKRRHPEAAKASDMAARQIDKLADTSATNEEREQRKRQLLRGPKEFRDTRGVPKSKP
jgi:hypothetical protein